MHRDIKPANIFLCRYGEEYDFVKVLDFGIVKATHDTRRDRDRRSRGSIAVHGTPAFIAPEQALGDADLDGRADIYATGCVAYWLLTGQLVFTADTPMALLLHHAQTPPTPPSARTELPIPAALDRPRAVVPGQGPRAPAAVGAGVVAPARARSRARTTGPRTWRGSGGGHTGRRGSTPA